MTPLDQMIAQDQLQMLKAAIPYASFGLQPSLAILSKWLELQRTIQLFSRPADLSMMSVDAPHVSPLEKNGMNMYIIIASCLIFFSYF